MLREVHFQISICWAGKCGRLNCEIVARFQSISIIILCECLTMYFLYFQCSTKLQEGFALTVRVKSGPWGSRGTSPKLLAILREVHFQISIYSACTYIISFIILSGCLKCIFQALSAPPNCKRALHWLWGSNRAPGGREILAQSLLQCSKMSTSIFLSTQLESAAD